MGVLKLVLAYDGTGFRGYARQPRVRTVQGALEDALTRILGHRPALSVAGRTDAGVHALGQVVSFETEADPGRVQQALNGMLAPEVVVRAAARAPLSFDARKSARAREYRYRLRISELPDPFTSRFEWHRPGRYRVGDMRRAARMLEGAHDFASFCRVPKDGSTNRRLDRLSIRATGDALEVRARANSFLHQMVRSLVGTLVAVGQGKIEAESIPSVLRARSRAAAGPVAPPQGLTLVRVIYGAGRQ
jgi:tRNA pseudouridine38-40 synthase